MFKEKSMLHEGKKKNCFLSVGVIYSFCVSSLSVTRFYIKKMCIDQNLTCSNNNENNNGYYVNYNFVKLSRNIKIVIRENMLCINFFFVNIVLSILKIPFNCASFAILLQILNAI